MLWAPEDDPETQDVDESEAVEIVDTIEWSGNAAESQVFELDPNSLKSGQDGRFSLLKVDLSIDASNASSTKLNYVLPDGVPVGRATLFYGSENLGWAKWDEKAGLTGSGFLTYNQNNIDLIEFEKPSLIDRDFKLELVINSQILEFTIDVERTEKERTAAELITGSWLDVGTRIFNHTIIERYHDMVYSVPSSGKLRYMASSFASLDLGSSEFTAGTESHKYNPDGGPEQNMIFIENAIGGGPHLVSWNHVSQLWIDTAETTIDEGVCRNSGIRVFTSVGPAAGGSWNNSVDVSIE